MLFSSIDFPEFCFIFQVDPQVEAQARDDDIQAQSLEEQLQQHDPSSLVGLSIRAGLSREEKAQRVAEAAAQMKFSEKDVLDALEGSRGEVAKLVCFQKSFPVLIHIIHCRLYQSLDIIFRVRVCLITPANLNTLGVTYCGWPPLHGTEGTWSWAS